MLTRGTASFIKFYDNIILTVFFEVVRFFIILTFLSLLIKTQTIHIP